MNSPSVPCLTCCGPTGMALLDVTAIPPGCTACLVVVCATCRASQKKSDTRWHPLWHFANGESGPLSATCGAQNIDADGREVTA